ncbi:MAG: hypothetical protein KDA47_04840 [Planctomycetales bacterium]|nr:hypothetical protein [Planctomycetales bacterium]
MKVVPSLFMVLALAGLCGCKRTLAPPLNAEPENVDILLTSLESDSGETAATETVQKNPTGFADLTGVFKLAGAAPPRAPLPVSGSDVPLCIPSGKAPLDEAVVVGPSDGLANVLIYLNTDIPDDPKWIHQDTYAASRDATLEFDQRNCMFLTHVFAIRTSQTMKIMNSDTVAHNTNISPRKGASPFNETIPVGGYVARKPGGESPDPFPVTCSIHPWMKAYMITRGNPYFAVTAEDGSFAIPKVPAGVKLEFRAWQEKAGFLQELTVNGQAEKWSKGRKEITLTPDTPLKLDVVVNASLLQ